MVLLLGLEVYGMNISVNVIKHFLKLAVMQLRSCSNYRQQ